MLYFVTAVHVLLCVFMIFVILLQPGKDAGMGAALGGGAATSAFGGRGAVTFLSKITAVCAGLFFLTSLGLSFVGMKASVAAGDDEPGQSAPAEAGQTGGTQGATTPPAAGGSTGVTLDSANGPASPAGNSEPVQAAPHSGGQPPAPSGTR